MFVSIGYNHGIAALSSCTSRQRCLGNHEREYFKVTTSTTHIRCTHCEGQSERWRGQVHVKYNSLLWWIYLQPLRLQHGPRNIIALWWFYASCWTWFPWKKRCTHVKSSSGKRKRAIWYHLIFLWELLTNCSRVTYREQVISNEISKLGRLCKNIYISD